MKLPIITNIGFLLVAFILTSAAFALSNKMLRITNGLNIVKLLTFNIENGGTQIDFGKVVEVAQKSQADVICIQEGWGNLEKLATALHWHHISRQQHIISRYPIYVDADGGLKYIFIELKPHAFFVLSNLHLPDDGYGPESLAAGLTKERILHKEIAVRLKEVLPVAKTLSHFAARGFPVFITGDFNSPSHLDWISGSEKKLAHHKETIDWPVTRMLAQYGFKDAYRLVYPDPLKRPGCTWPAFRPFITHSIDGYNPSKQDLSDRIDFIFTQGRVKVRQMQLLGEAHAPDVDIAITPWPSDHRAVTATVELTPHLLTLRQRKKIREILPIKIANPLVKAIPKIINIDQPLQIVWQGAPGYRYDYIRIIPHKAKQLAWGEATRIYTYGEENGSVLVNAGNIRGNWQNWCAFAAGRWPLQPGRYIIQLMLDDSDTVLANTDLTVLG